MKKGIFFLFFWSFSWVFSQEQTLSLLFIGDIMGHEPQIRAAYDSNTGKYNYQPVFDKISHRFKSVDFAIGNLEVTFAGKPYSGYPQFSSPEALAQACKDSGIGTLVTANNHSCDGGKKGLLRTMYVIDSVGINRTGTFRDEEEFEAKNLLILQKNGISVGLLNYTYGTNGLPIPKPIIVNLIDYQKIKIDIEKAKKANVDKIIVFIHWGEEYSSIQNKEQEKIADFLFENGVDFVIGSHPHVIQPMHYYPATDFQKERLVVYSLGNFVSNQRTPPRDGGAMFEIVLERKEKEVRIKKQGYHLIWVHKTMINNRLFYEVLPCSEYENGNYLDRENKLLMNFFIHNSRKLLRQHNTCVEEVLPQDKFPLFYQLLSGS